MSREKYKSNIATIGLFIPAVNQYFQRELLTSLVSILDQHDCNVNVFCGQPIKSLDPKNTRGELIFTLPSPKSLEGIVVITNTIGMFTPLENFLPMLEQYKGIPIVSIALPIKDAYHISIDNAKGIADITGHLIEKHWFHNIVHIAGPKWSEEAQERAKSFLYTLQKHSLIIDNKRIIRGDFTRESGKAAAEVLLKEYATPPQAVVCASDEIAIGLCEGLAEHGINVPDDIAVTGFDNILYSMLHSPSLTTVNQPLDDMLSKALEIIIDLHSGLKPQKEYRFEPKLVERDSCSCKGIRKNIIQSQNYLSTIKDVPFVRAENDREMLVSNCRLIIGIFTDALGYRDGLPKGMVKHIEAVYEALVEDFCSESAPHTLIRAFERFYVWVHQKYNEPIEWETLALSIQTILKTLFPQKEKQVFISQFSLQTMFELDMIAQKVYRRDLFDHYNMFSIGNHFIDQLSTVTSFTEMIMALRTNCHLFNFEECYCCLLETPVLINEFFNLTQSREINMVFGQVNRTILDELKFTTKTMLPQEILDNTNENDLAFFTLNSGELYYGYFCCSINDMLKPLASTVRQQLSNMLDRLDLIGKLEENTQMVARISLQDALTGLLNRRGFFESGQKLLLAALEKEEELVVLFGDMDDLKEINDTFGHQAGDLALQSVALCLKDALRDGDIVSRFGGDEFAMVLRGKNNVKNIDLVMSRIYGYFDDFNQISNFPYDISISFGYSAKMKNQHRDLESLIEDADKRLYTEKIRRKAARKKAKEE